MKKDIKDIENIQEKSGLTPDKAKAILQNYNCCFIKPSSKRPEGKSWQNKPRQPEEWNGQGLGIITGKLNDNEEYGVYGFDFDTRDQRAANLSLDQAKFLLGENLIYRIGFPPKFLIPFKCKTSLKKKVSREFYSDLSEKTKETKNQLEILGQGQQFVIAGIHPDTQKPYQWYNSEGERVDFSKYTIDDFPEVTEQKIDMLMGCIDIALSGAGFQAEKPDLMELARKAQIPPRQANHEQSGIIDKVNSQYNIEETLLSHGYKKSGNRFINPESKSGNAGGVILNGRYFSHNSTDIFNDGHSHDAFDVICKLKYGDDMTAAIRELAPIVDTEGQRERQKKFMQEQEHQTAELFSSQSVSVEAQQLADRIKFRINAEFKAIDVEVPDIEIKPEVIEKIISNTVFSGVKNKFTVISPNGSTSYFTEKDILKFAQKIYGKFYKSEILNKKFDELGKNIDAETKKRISAIPSSVLLDFLKLRQRDDGAWSLDMFADHNRMAFTEDRVNIILCHKPFPQHGSIEPEIIGDYKKHFQEIDEVLKFLVMSVFIPDRKKSYLWIKADSDWGKGFFYSVLKDLNLAVELSVPLVQKIFKGEAVALSPSHFKRSFAIIIDEFRSIQPELKQLQSQITISPKWLMQQDVAIYSKLFFSAEGVEALTGGGFGIEDQFANRFSYIEKAGALNTRDVFKKVGMYRYKKTVLAYTAKFLNEKIKDMQALGPQKSADVAEQWINKFYAKNCISKQFGRMSEQLPKFAEEIRDFYIKRHKNFSSVNQIDGDVVQGTAGLILLNPAKAIDDYIAENIAYSDRAKFSKKKSELYQLMSADGRGARTQRLNEEKTKYGVLIEKRKNLASLELVK
ncbi:MAG: bifunctional DNA primase/polymerase [Desulforegulaceae bacterium]|nr:bifunctional DNA primase/polymerase [Desulforegulaceae bacterium]